LSPSPPSPPQAEINRRIKDVKTRAVPPRRKFIGKADV
jgi:hypothetical protein